MKFDRKIAAAGLVAAGIAFGTAASSAQAQDDSYAGGAAVAWLPQEFVLGGANPLGVNFLFPGNPYVPYVNGTPVPLFDAAALAGGNVVPTNMLIVSSAVQNDNGSWSVSLTVQTSDGAPFVNDNTPIIVQTAQGPQTATDFVIDLGNGYELPGFPVDGVDVCSDAGIVSVDVEYWFTRLDGSENREYGDTTGPFLTPNGFVFAWGYALYADQPDNPDNPKNINRAGFIATFFPVTDNCAPDCVGDLDGNGAVDGADLSLILGAWNTNDADADLDGSGNVDGADLSIVLGAWGDC